MPIAPGVILPSLRPGHAPLLFNANVCARCQRCVSACPSHVHSFSQGMHHIDRTRCIQCGACIEQCPNSIAGRKRKCTTPTHCRSIRILSLRTDRSLYPSQRQERRHHPIRRRSPFTTRSRRRAFTLLQGNEDTTQPSKPPASFRLPLTREYSHWSTSGYSACASLPIRMPCLTTIISKKCSAY